MTDQANGGKRGRGRPRALPRVTLICPQCKKPFEKLRHDARFCSKPCYYEWRVQEASARPARSLADFPFRRFCEHCEKEFGTDRPSARFCTHPCYREWKAARATTKSTLRPTERVCPQCQESFETRYRHTKFCSFDCYDHWRQAHPEASPFYVGGREDLYGNNWKEQAALARERDDHTCQDCGRQQRSPLLHVHHLQSRRSFKGDWETANRLENLVTLCRRCHRKRENAERRASIATHDPENKHGAGA